MMWDNFDNQMKMCPEQFVGGLVKCDLQSSLLPSPPNPNVDEGRRRGIEMDCNRESVCFEECSCFIFWMT